MRGTVTENDRGKVPGSRRSNEVRRILLVTEREDLVEHVIDGIAAAERSGRAVEGEAATNGAAALAALAGGNHTDVVIIDAWIDDLSAPTLAAAARASAKVDRIVLIHDHPDEMLRTTLEDVVFDAVYSLAEAFRLDFVDRLFAPRRNAGDQAPWGMFSLLSEAALVVGKGGEIRYANATFARLVGETQPTLEGRDLSTYLPECSRRELFELKPGEPRFFELRRRGGARRRVRAACIDFPGSGGVLRGLILAEVAAASAAGD